MTDTPDDLWLPAPARARHDEPITHDRYERRERSYKAAEETIVKAFGERLSPAPDTPQR